MAAVLCVSGMHRSGTSLVASWLERCGVALHDGRLIGPLPSNPLGHFEDFDLATLHASALRELAPGSGGWRVYAPEFRRFTSGQLDRALELAAARDAKYPLWGWKDPRTLFFLEQWKELIPELKVLLLWRPCAPTVDSLLRRARRRQWLSLRPAGLWLAHSRLACVYRRAHPDDTLLLPLDAVLRREHDAFALIRERLDLDLEFRPLSEIYDPGLLHARASRLARLLSRRQETAHWEEELARCSDLHACA